MSDDMITIDASALSSFDYSTYIYNYFSSENVGTTKGASTYYGGTYTQGFGYYNGTEVGFRYPTDPTNNSQVLLQGSDIAYDGIYNQGHGISGNVDGFTLGSYDENTTYSQDDAAGTRSELEGVIKSLVVSGLDYSAAVGSGTGAENLVNTIYYALQKANTIVDLDSNGTSGQEYVDQIYALLSQKAQHFIGSSGADNYTGTIYGDLIEGGAGADTLAGGAGDDTYVVTDASNVIVEDADGGDDTIKTALSHWQMAGNVENLIQTGDAGQWSYGTATSNTITANDNGGVLYGMGGGDTLNGRAGDDELHAMGFTDDGASDVLNGGAGNDLLDGGAGADTMTGGTGDDTYVIDNKKDVVTEVDGGGTDKVSASINFTLSDFVERLVLTGSDDLKGTGNTLDNILNGNDGSNVLKGLGGDDTIRGGGGADKIYGGLGIDRLAGGAGADAFYFQTGETGDTKKTADVVTDFTAKQHDVIDLSGLDANDGKAGVQDFDFIGIDKFSHHAGELRYVTGADDTYIAGDTDGDGKADFMIHLGGALKVTEDFFHL